jgi:maltokinase
VVIDPQTRAAVEAVPVQALLPPRAQSRAESLYGRVAIVDALDLGLTADGDQAVVVVVNVTGSKGERDIVAPGRVRAGTFERDPGVACHLRPGVVGRFSADVRGAGIREGPVREINVDQSNDSVVMGEGPGAVMVKWQLDAVESPASDRLISLAGSGVTPDVRAVLKWMDPHGIERTILTAADYLPGAQDGWTWAVDLVRAHARGEGVEAIEPFAVLGEMTARMHLAFAESGVETWDRCAILHVHGACRADLDEAVRVIDGAEGARLRDRFDRIARRMDSLVEIDSTPIIDIHGDFHIGQSLRVTDAGADRYAFVDFDGNPVLTPAERMNRQPAARDVAGMLASIDHVARVVNYRTEELDPRPAAIWIPHAQDAFLAAYQVTLSAAGQRALLDDRLLVPLMLDQECREFVYSARHLPHWRYVPDAVLTAMFPVEADVAPSDEGVQ